MARVNKKYLDKGLTTEAWNRFLNRIKKSHSTDDLIINLHAFLTPTEIAMLEKRLCIPILVERKQSYKAIGDLIDVSPVTISFVKHNLTKKPTVHRKYDHTPPLARAEEKEKTKIPGSGLGLEKNQRR